MSPLRAPAELSGLRLLVLDVDGVLTDGTVLYGGGVDEVKAFHTRDGAGMAVYPPPGSCSSRCAAVSSGRRMPATYSKCRVLPSRR